MESAKLPLSSGLLSLTLTSSHTDSPPPQWSHTNADGGRAPTDHDVYYMR